MDLEEFEHFIRQVEGLCSERDCFFLYSLAKSIKLSGDILDIGSFKGRVSISFAKALIDTGQRDRVYAIEANFFNTKDQLLRNIECFAAKDLVVPIFGHSARVNKGWQRPLKLVWVDTDGNFLSGKCDFILWERYLLKGGVIAFSCASSPKIKRVVEDCIIDSKRFERVTTIGSVVFAYKNKETPAYSSWDISYIRVLYTLYYNMRKIFYNLICITLPSLTGKDLTIKRIINRIFEKILII